MQIQVRPRRKTEARSLGGGRGACCIFIMSPGALAPANLARNLIVPMTNVLGPGSKDSIIMSHTCPGQYESPHGAAAVAFDPRCITYLFIDL